MTCPSDNELAELVDGSLPVADRERVEQHLDRCAACTRLAAELAWVVGDAPAAPPGYRFVRELDGAFEAIDREDRHVIVELGAVDARLARTRHPNLAEVLAVGEGFVVYEHLTRTARSWSEGKSPEHVLALWRHVLAGLAALHRAGLVHGRLSPDHVFVDGERVVIGGFARPLARTSGYVAAEVLEGAPPTAASDQLAVCVAIHEALAGKKPFTGATAGALAVAMASPPEPPAGLDRRRAAVVIRGMARDPSQRWPGIDALASALDAPPRDRTRWLIAAVAIATVAAVIAIVL